MSLLDLVGRTPLVPLPTGVRSPHVRLLGKHEGQNPGGSVKDRAALYLVALAAATLLAAAAWAMASWRGLPYESVQAAGLGESEMHDRQRPTSKVRALQEQDDDIELL